MAIAAHAAMNAFAKLANLCFMLLTAAFGVMQKVCVSFWTYPSNNASITLALGKRGLPCPLTMYYIVVR